MPPPFKFWSADHWLNFGIFLLGAISTIGITAGTSWTQVPSLFTPATVIGFLIATFGFLRSANTNAARDPALGTRATDPSPTAPLVQVDHHIEAVPPVNPGRPVDPEKKE
jgi:hypothetical protein